jgi:hypothetical protein
MNFDKTIQILQTIGIYLIVFTIFQTYQGQKLERDTINTELQFERKKEALKLWDVWNNTFNSNVTLRHTMKLIEPKKSRDAIDWNSVVNANSETDSQFIIRKDCMTLLNLFEQIAIAYNHNIGNAQIIEEGFKDVVFDYYKKLEPFIHSYKDSRDGRGWPALDFMVKNWEITGKKSKADVVD